MCCSQVCIGDESSYKKYEIHPLNLQPSPHKLSIAWRKDILAGYMHMQVVMYDDNVDVDALQSAANLNPARLTIRGDVRCSNAKLNR